MSTRVSLPETAAKSLEYGVLALLSRRTRVTLLAAVNGDLPLVALMAACAWLVGVRSRAVPGLARASRIVERGAFAVLLDCTMAALVFPGERGLTLLNLLAVVFVAGSTRLESFAGPAQYVLVTNTADALSALLGAGEGLGGAFLLALLSRLAHASAAGGVADMVAVECLSGWLTAWLPRDLLLPTVIGLLYLVARAVERYPPLSRLNWFAVYAVTNDLDTRNLPAWLLGAFLLGLWRLGADPVGNTLLVVAGAQVWVRALVDFVQQDVAEKDPVPALFGLLLAIGVLLEPPPKKEGAKPC